MTARPVLVALLVAAVAMPVGAVTGAPSATQESTIQAQSPAQMAANETNATFGASVASFVQASSAEADSEVEQGMFQARFNRSNASERPAVVRDRVEELEARLTDLRERRAALLNDSNVTVADRAKAARLSARIDGLQRSINGTAVAAERAGLNLSALDRLRTDARNLTGPEVAAIATDLVDAGPPAGADGPPEERPDGGATNETDTNRTDGNPGGGPSNGDGAADGGSNAGDGSSTSDGSGSDTVDESGA